MEVKSPATRTNYWAIITLIIGVISFMLGVTAPVPFIPIISLLSYPLGIISLLTGWYAIRLAQVTTERRQAQWGIGLGCAGCLIDAVTRIITFLIVMGFLAVLIAAAFQQQR